MGAAVAGSGAADILGYLGGVILSICVLPQIWKTFKTKSAGDISLSWTILYTSGLSCTFAYLFLVGATAAWIPMTVEIAGALVIMAMKLYYDRREARLANNDAASQVSARSSIWLGVSTPRTALSFSTHHKEGTHHHQRDSSRHSKVSAWQQDGSRHSVREPHHQDGSVHRRSAPGQQHDVDAWAANGTDAAMQLRDGADAVQLSIITEASLTPAQLAARAAAAGITAPASPDAAQQANGLPATALQLASQQLQHHR
jgi:uncharacterized protein with PQ loop repeat